MRVVVVDVAEPTLRCVLFLLIVVLGNIPIPLFVLHSLVSFGRGPACTL